MDWRATLGAIAIAALLGAACSSQADVTKTGEAGSGGGGGANAGTGGGAEAGGGAGPEGADAGAAGAGANAAAGGSVDLLDAYCDMEAECIPECLCQEETCGCGSPTRVAECARDVRTWGPLTQGEPCVSTFRAWLECITQLGSCEQVQEFFAAHPDGVTAETPCGRQYSDLDCDDFEPLTEYSFP